MNKLMIVTILNLFGSFAFADARLICSTAGEQGSNYSLTFARLEEVQRVLVDIKLPDLKDVVSADCEFLEGEDVLDLSLLCAPATINNDTYVASIEDNSGQAKLTKTSADGSLEVTTIPCEE